jgi:flagellar protein FlaG
MAENEIGATGSFRALTAATHSSAGAGNQTAAAAIAARSPKTTSTSSAAKASPATPVTASPAAGAPTTATSAPAAAAPVTGTSVASPAATATSSGSAAELQSAIAQASANLANAGRTVNFSVDAQTGISIATIRDAHSGAVIQQIPGSDLIALAKMLANWSHGKHMLFDLIA